MMGIMHNKKKFGIGEYGILVALISLWVILALSNEYFRKPENIMNVFRESSFLGIAAIGMTFVIMIKGIDLSVGGMLSLLAVVAALILPVMGIILTIIITCLLGALCGLFNGILIVKVHIPSFIASLGTYQIFRSIAYILTKDELNVVVKNTDFTKISNSGLFVSKAFSTGIPYAFIIFFILTIIATVLLKNMAFGRSVLAIGNSEKASYIAGIKVDKIKILTYTLLGFFVSISAILYTSRLWAARAEIKPNFEFDVITIVVMGGCALAGGRGNIISTFFSSMLFVTITNAMSNFEIDPYSQYIIKGLILMIAFSMYNVRAMVSEFIQKRRKRKEYALADASANTGAE